MVDFEYPDLAGQMGPVSEGIQAGAEHDVLADAAPDAVGQAGLGIAAAAGDLGPGAGQDRVGAVRPVKSD